MSVRARFYIAEITKSAHNPGASQVTLSAVSRGDQNKTWAKATPSGQIKMTINNEPAASWFENRLGEDCDITFTAVPTLIPGDGHPFRSADVPAGHYLSGACGDCGYRPSGEHNDGVNVPD